MLPFVLSEAEGQAKAQEASVLFMFRFCALRGQKRNTGKTESTMLP